MLASLTIPPLSPPILFFVLGMVAALVRSNLRVPKAVTKLLSLYLLWAIGFQGGVKIAQGGMHRDAVLAVAIGLAFATVMPLIVFAILRRRIGLPDAAAVAAAYGSVSAVTFLTAASVLDAAQIPYGGHMVAVMALMESPAIVAAVILLRRAEAKAADLTDVPAGGAKRIHWGHLLHESFLNGPVLLLLGSLIIGMITREKGYQAFKPLCTDLFNGVLVFFLLDLGLLAARRLRGFLRRGPTLIAFGLVLPPVAAGVAIAAAWCAGLGVGDATLLAVLAASASYIAVPAACRIAIPKADPSVYVGMALAITFPFNIVVGIPLYLSVIRALWAA